MGTYYGSKSLDAEIILDLEKGTLTTDYSLNKFGSPFSSNNSVIRNSEWLEIPIKKRLPWALYVTGLAFLGPFMALFMFYGTIIFNSKHVKDHKAQHEYQKILRWYYSIIRGIGEKTCEGKLVEPILKFEIPNNMWLTYEMTGEYKDKVRKISLMRNMVKNYKFGKFPREKQDGWNFIFEFSEIPASGSCRVKYIS
jgi:hypothetical protein